jgi:hypothetical protein
MNSGLNKYDAINLWDRWLKATGVDNGCGFRVPVEVWNAAWNGNWPDDEATIRWILEEYLDLETAKAHRYLELVLPLREEAEAALNAAKRHRQVEIDADIDEVIKTIRGLGREPDEKPSAGANRGEKPSRKRDRWMRSAVTTVITFAIGALVGFVGAYNSTALNRAADTTVSRSPEIRRAIPVEPEVRRAIPVEPEIRKAIPAHGVSPTHARVIRAR